MNNNLITPESKIEDVRFSVVDVETTGLSASNNRIIEIAIVNVENLKIKSKFHSLVNPRTAIPSFITQFTGISNDDVEDAPYFDEIVNQIKNTLTGSVLTAHNLPFDSSFIDFEFKRAGVELEEDLSLCTLRLSRRIYPELKSKSLSSVSSHLKIKNNSAHRALSDAGATAKILIKIIAKLKKESNLISLNDLLELQKKKDITPRIKIKKELEEDLFGLPNAPGIYYFTNSKNEIIYIGKAKSLRDRLKSYFLASSPKKSQKIVKQAKHLKVEITNSELTALLTESEIIKKTNPKYNHQLKSYGNKYFLRVNKSHKYPDLEITNKFDFDGNDYFGLFITRRKAETLLEMLNKIFALRECDDKEFNKHRGCFLMDIERCTAPCINNNSNDLRYKDELINVYDFLCGRNQNALNRLLHKMRHLASQQKYEKAGEIKELVDLILAQVHKNSLLEEPINTAKVIFEISSEFAKDYLILINGKIYIKKYILNKRDNFDEVINDYYSGNIVYDTLPNDEDLEKLKISLNWLIKNRNQVRTFYLQRYDSEAELMNELSNSNFSRQNYVEKEFDIQSIVKDRFT